MEVLTLVRATSSRRQECLQLVPDLVLLDLGRKTVLAVLPICDNGNISKSSFAFICHRTAVFFGNIPSPYQHFTLRDGLLP